MLCYNCFRRYRSLLYGKSLYNIFISTGNSVSLSINTFYSSSTSINIVEIY